MYFVAGPTGSTGSTRKSELFFVTGTGHSFLSGFMLYSFSKCTPIHVFLVKRSRKIIWWTHLHVYYLISAVTPCAVEDILKRPDEDKPTIDSTNPADNPNLSPDDSSTWTSTPPASITVTFDEPEQVMRVEIGDVSGTQQVSVTLESNGTPVGQVDIDTSDSVSILDTFYRVV